jgi:hypothetical protein
MSEMREATLDDIRASAANAGDYIKVITGHWTAGWPDHANVDDLKDYAVLILDDGSILYREDFTEHLSHSWHDNSNNLGIAVCGCVGATTDDLGPNAPNLLQYKTMAKIVKVICEELDLDIDSTFFTHAERADLYGYGPATTFERWDLWRLFDKDENGTGGDQMRDLAKSTQL